MILPEETCRFGLRAKHVLEENGYTLDEHILRSCEEVDAFEEEQGGTLRGSLGGRAYLADEERQR